MINTEIKEGIFRELQIKLLVKDPTLQIRMYAVENVIQNLLKSYVISRKETESFNVMKLRIYSPNLGN